MTDLLGVSAVLAVFAYAFVNGFHDGGNVIATIIASRSIKVRTAFIIGCAGEFAGAMLLGTAVAATVGTRFVDLDAVLGAGKSIGALFIILSIAGSVLWNLITAVIGLPCSSSHALMGSLIGAGLVLFGNSSIDWSAFMIKVVAAMFASPLIGLLAGYLIMRWLRRVLDYYTKSIEIRLKKLQYISMTGLAMSHGSSDGQKAMGLLALLLLVQGHTGEFYVPVLGMAGCALAISLGMSVAGWKIMHTIGKKLYEIEPVHSLASQTAAAAVLGTAALTGFPVSTTQIVTSAVMGVGAGESIKKVKWQIAVNIIVAWFVTIPASAAVAAILSKAALLLMGAGV